MLQNNTMDEQKKSIEPEVNLEKLRDEKCIPIAQNIFKELSVDMMKSEDYTGVTLKALSLMLAFDLNITSEVSYINQLILSVLAGLNQTVQTCDLINDDDRYNEIASKILVIVSNGNVRMGTLTPEEIIADFATVKEELKGLFVAEKLSQIEVEYIMKNIFTSFTNFNNLVGRQIEIATAKMECKILGIDTMSDLSLKKVDETLKSGLE